MVYAQLHGLEDKKAADKRWSLVREQDEQVLGGLCAGRWAGLFYKNATYLGNDRLRKSQVTGRTLVTRFHN